MTPETADWLAGLQAFLAEDRTRPLHRSTPDPSPPVMAEVRRLVARSVRHWVNEELPGQLRARAAWAAERGPQTDPTPAVLLTTTPHGLDAAVEAVTGSPQTIACLLEVEYRRWCRLRPDDAMHHHVTAWNWVKTRVPEVRQAEFADQPLAEGEAYWLHRTGMAGIADEEHRTTALLAFDGRRSRLLAASVVETRFE